MSTQDSHPTQQLKRKSDVLSPPINETQKRYVWTPNNLLTKNRFYPLSTQDSDNQETSANTQNTKLKIPPIFLHSAENYQEVIRDINGITKAEFTTKYSSNQLRINLTSADDYRELTRYYDTNKIEYHTFQNPSNRPLSVVIKGIPLSVSEDEIKDELTEKDFTIISVTRLLNRNKFPLPICAIDLPATESSADIYKVTTILQSIVTVEPRRKSATIPQCHRCQRVGHTKNYCALKPRCVKCTGEHMTSACTKKQGVPPTCVNCGENHPANYRGCKYHKEQRDQRPQAGRPPTRPIFNRVNYNPTDQRTYAQATTNLNNRSMPNTTTNNLQQSQPMTSSSSIVNDILQALKELITPIMSQIKTFIINTLIPNLLNG